MAEISCISDQGLYKVNRTADCAIALVPAGARALACEPLLEPRRADDRLAASGVDVAPHAEHLSSRGRVSALTRPVWPHGHEILGSVSV